MPKTTMHWKLCIGLFIIFLIVILSKGCEHAEPMKPEQLEPTIESIQSNIFNQNCAVSGCHLGANAPLGLELSEGNAYGNLVNVPSQELPQLDRVEPGDPDNSYLVWKIEGRSGIQGERMPRGRDPLSQEEINAIRQWIANGALPAGNAPVVSDIPNQMTVRGESFDSFDLDDFVSDADHPDSVINWAATGETNFTVSINSENVVTIQVNDTNFVGSDTVTFTATDPDGFSDSDEAIFAVQPPQVTFTQIQQNIFNQSCAFSGCHDGGSNQLPGVMDLREGMAFQSIVNVQSIEIPQLNRVEPGQPDSSYIVWKIEGRQGIQGQRMPLGGSPLSQEKINMMRDWILNGAPNN